MKCNIIQGKISVKSTINSVKSTIKYVNENNQGDFS